MATSDKAINGDVHRRKFRVIIVGGGIAGLTLANSLQRAGIDYILLEARREIAPQVGASIGLGPNGSRILDQLGCYEDIMTLTAPIEYTASHKPDGSLMRPRTDAFQLVQARANYCMCFLDRQLVLRVLANHVVDQKKILLEKRVVNIQHRVDGVTVECDDKSAYYGDIVVGADGVHSKVRREMWRAADEFAPGYIPQSEKTRMTAEYKCLFGISTPVAGLPSHHFDVTYMKDLTAIVITGKDERVYWFLIARMPVMYTSDNIPRFSKEEACGFAENNLDIPLAPRAEVIFGDLWKLRETYNLVALEEADYSHWSWGRFACLGDSVHKMTPNLGSGGNCAIESAASLANSLHEIVYEVPGRHVDIESVKKALQKYQQVRNLRASSTVKMSNYITRLHAVRSPLEHLVAYYIMPRAGDLLVDLASLAWIGATRLDYVGVPPRSLAGNMPFNQEQGIGKNENVLMRALAASPFLALGIYHLRILKRFVPSRAIRAAVAAGTLNIGGSSFKLFEAFYHLRFVDVLWKGIVTLFVPSAMGFDPASSWQMWTSLADFGVLYAIMLVESARRANMLTPMRMPTTFGFATQLFGAGTALPLYHFLYTSLVPISSFRATDLRLTDLRYTRSVLPAMLSGYYVPYLLSYIGPTTKIRHAAIWIFLMSPLWVSLSQHALAKIAFRSTIASDRIRHVNRDIGVIRLTIAPLAFWSGISWLNALLRAPMSLSEIYIPPWNRATSFISKVQNVCKNDQIFFSVSSLLWISYLFRDLRNAGMIKQSFFRTSMLLVSSTACLGPGTTVALFWLWREHILATKRHKSAVVKPESLHENERLLSPNMDEV